MTSALDLVKEFSVNRNTIRIEPEETLRRDYLTDSFVVQYDENIGIEGLDTSILSIPFLLNVAPLVWLSGREYRIASMDASLANGLKKVQQTFHWMYPGIRWSGRLIPDRLVLNRMSCEKRVAILFSGGVDSTFTSLYHYNEEQILITICGADICRDNAAGWRNIQRQNLEFGDKYGRKCSFIMSNFRQCMNYGYLNALHPEIPTWWGYVQHGLALAGLAAPLTVGLGSQKLYVPSTHTADFNGAWGSHPSIDNKLAWAGVQVKHDGYKWSRQQKLKYIVAFFHKHGDSKPLIRVCYARPKGNGNNCCSCEKCLRTMTGLLLEGEAVQPYGFSVPSSDIILKLVRRRFSTYTLNMGEDELFMWKDLQRTARTLPIHLPVCIDQANVTEFAQWLVDFDLVTYWRRYKQLRSMKVAVRNLLRQLRAGYRAARTILTNFKR